MDSSAVRTAQLLITNTFSANAFSLIVLSTFTAIYSQSIKIPTTSLHTFIKENKYIENGIGFIRIRPTLGVVGLEVLGLNVLVLNSCAYISKL